MRGGNMNPNDLYDDLLMMAYDDQYEADEYYDDLYDEYEV